MAGYIRAFDAGLTPSTAASLHPMFGGGVIFTLKPEAGMVLRLEYARGESDNEACYLNIGHPF